MDKEEQIFEHENILRSCCFRIDKRCLDYSLKMSVTIGIAMFAAIQIAREASDKSAYLAILTGILGVFVPAPQLHK